MNKQTSKLIKLGFYRHFKGNIYRVLHLAKDSETEQYFVVYQPQYGDMDVWIRPLSMFDETIERDGKIFKRFTFLGENIDTGNASKDD
ncbi:DUF1653 domain-containing protein [Thalassotalea ponticola]|uniref:DUF1653 domain-containing protein n=1 Tax=Thalassotalea ponticola TaxID=1523392 RepID=UPI0025B2E329|nr:DUF1653 domain-containing protein [Thalassotalea ponticola]MDN3653102.1 DUF1653 domain-containing protein [Thalassotalea ponticola]